MKTLKIVILLAFIFITPGLFAQKGHGHGKDHKHGHPPGKVVVKKKRSPYRPASVVVYHPHWHPAYTYHRRWVYFPQYDLYWDNWRNHYVYQSGSVWISRPSAPSFIINVNLEKARSRELEEDYDDEDAVYMYNVNHKN